MISARRTYFIVLVLILLGGLGAFLAVTPSKSNQLVIGFITAAAYAVWGWMYHAAEKDLHPKIMIEYLLIASIAFSLLWLALG